MVVWSTVSFCSASKKVVSCTIDDLTNHLQKVIKKDEISVTDILEDATVKEIGHITYGDTKKFSENLVEYKNKCD